MEYAAHIYFTYFHNMFRRHNTIAKNMHAQTLNKSQFIFSSKFKTTIVYKDFVG